MGSIGTGSGVDLSHHINRKSKARHPSPLKDIIRFMSQDTMISLAGGLPHPTLFPLHTARFDCLPPSSSIPDPDKGGTPDDPVSLMLGRNSGPGELDLTQFLQYGSGTGNEHLISLCKEITNKVHSPPCEYECLLHPGNTNAWAKVVGMLCEDDDYILVEEYTYPSAQVLWIPLGVRAVPVSADAQGISAIVLRDVLANWDEKSRGAKRPTVLYLVAVGSNPTEYPTPDIIIVEDDPYYFLQYPPYSPSANFSATEFQPLDTASSLKSLTPSFLSLDTQSRVIRLESFSKTVFPGLRLGYFVANPLFTERLLRATEVETQDPAGLSQAFILALLKKWGRQYRVRRDWIVGAFHKHFTILPAANSRLLKADGYVACLADCTGQLKPVFSFIDPGAGMFIWSKWYFAGVKRFAELSASDKLDPEQAFATELWNSWASELFLLTPGSYYHHWQGKNKVTRRERGAEKGTAHFRFSFATPTEKQINAEVERVKTVVDRYWN
ncbi:hypothetical protein AN4156.2 [Aspergillus nidulans FGSC A4]|uniref:Aromatic-amino-acid transaminase, hypothetical (Eurofung) n=1 Tax=Emericella nidulans (strain FGSC A4 / ATCC 38163 / CBS 112.46 / NRRL 194 / M139) TaxID=227321 RepID=Q5B5M4_EMENI|nr:hypothetical protein [Aspergillus nidulans FGSC A4]EAA59417.1 hypothetical protein AN4156.2 [Aspergillus nidulans FGSC A4]CBF74591.1 TPA: aromatic-amino-acid transaminase, hypothetical (Eurofung) [Aspergillus nidulans FGSC A4]|eukprot:XP_661760.1 hypothetical protein AN4156.2 [Aspergillus nidulans FGSC A4]